MKGEYQEAIEREVVKEGARVGLKTYTNLSKSQDKFASPENTKCDRKVFHRTRRVAFG